MRLWHYLLIPYLPDSQLIAQWRELNSIYANNTKHILINYVYDKSESNLQQYSMYVLNELKRRGININTSKYDNKFNNEQLTQLNSGLVDSNINPYPSVQNDRYLQQCFYNLQEKYDRGQKDFGEDKYKEMLFFLIKYFSGKGIQFPLVV